LSVIAIAIAIAIVSDVIVVNLSVIVIVIVATVILAVIIVSRCDVAVAVVVIITYVHSVVVVVVVDILYIGVLIAVIVAIWIIVLAVIPVILATATAVVIPCSIDASIIVIACVIVVGIVTIYDVLPHLTGQLLQKAVILDSALIRMGTDEEIRTYHLNSFFPSILLYEYFRNLLFLIANGSIEFPIVRQACLNPFKRIGVLPGTLRALLGEMVDKVLLKFRNALRKVVETIFAAFPVQ
jgi:hypothetical protein